MAAIPKGTPLAQETGPLQPKALNGCKIIVYPKEPRPGYADVVLNICAREGFTPAKLELTQDFQSAISLVSVGVGLSVVPASMIVAAAPSPTVRRRYHSCPTVRLRPESAAAQTCSSTRAPVYGSS